MRWAIVIALACVGCRPHVTLVPPPPDATAEQRVQAFEQLHAKSEKTTWTTTCRTTSGCSTTVEKELRLANGARVYHAEDLLPVLPPDSESARAVHAARRTQSRQKWYVLGLVGSVAGSFVIFSQTENGTAALIFFGATAIPTAFFAWRNYYAGVDHLSRANETYNDGLAQKLNVCVQDLAVVPCESIAPPALPQ